MVENNPQEKPAKESENQPKALPAKPNWKGKRGRMLQQTGAALLAEPGTDEEKLTRFLEKREN